MFLRNTTFSQMLPHHLSYGGAIKPVFKDELVQGEYFKLKKFCIHYLYFHAPTLDKRQWKVQSDVFTVCACLCSYLKYISSFSVMFFFCPKSKAENGSTVSRMCTFSTQQLPAQVISCPCFAAWSRKRFQVMAVRPMMKRTYCMSPRP